MICIKKMKTLVTQKRNLIITRFYRKNIVFYIKIFCNFAIYKNNTADYKKIKLDHTNDSNNLKYFVEWQ